jgi:hypothetical protein
MSLLESVLAQPAIKLSLGLAALMLLFALLLIVGGRARRMLAALASTRRHAHNFGLVPAQQSQQGNANTGPAPLPSAAAAVSPPQAELTPPASAVTAAPAASPSITPVAAPNTPVEPSESKTGEIQSLLESVFLNEEQTARYEVLMRGMTAMSMTELLDLSRQIAAQLNAASQDSPAPQAA